MKNYFLGALAYLMLTPFAQAQEEKVLVKLPKVQNIGFYITPEFQYGQVNSMTHSFSGWSAGVIFNKRLSAGFTRIGLFNPASAMTNSANPTNYNANFGGLKFEYTFFPKSPIHLVIPMTIGTGGYTESITKKGFGPRNMNNLFVAIPGIVAEANIFKFMKVYVGASYRYSVGINSNNPNSGALKGMVFNSGIRFGLFGKKVGH